MAGKQPNGMAPKGSESARACVDVFSMLSVGMKALAKKEKRAGEVAARQDTFTCAMGKDDCAIGHLTCAELHKLCTKQGLAVPSKAKKCVLLQLLHEVLGLCTGTNKRGAAASRSSTAKEAKRKKAAAPVQPMCKAFGVLARAYSPVAVACREGGRFVDAASGLVFARHTEGFVATGLQGEGGGVAMDLDAVAVCRALNVAFEGFDPDYALGAPGAARRKPRAVQVAVPGEAAAPLDIVEFANRAQFLL